MPNKPFFEMNTNEQKQFWTDLSNKDLKSEAVRKEVFQELVAQKITKSGRLGCRNTLVKYIQMSDITAVNLLLILRFHDDLDSYDERAWVLSRAMKTKNKAILKALQETGLFESKLLNYTNWFSNSGMGVLGIAQLRPLVEVFHWDIDAWSQSNSYLLEHCSRGDRSKLAQLYEQHLKRFFPINEERDLTKEETVNAETAKEAYNLYLNPLTSYCQNNLGDEKARKIYRDLSGEADQNIQLSVAYLKNYLATLLKSDSGEAATISSGATLALIQCYSAVNPNKTAQALGIHPSHMEKINPEILKLKEKQVSAYFALKCAYTVSFALTGSFIAAAVCLALLHNPALFPVVFIGLGVLFLEAISLPYVLPHMHATKNSVTEQLKTLSFLKAPTAAPDEATPPSEPAVNKPTS